MSIDRQFVTINNLMHALLALRLASYFTLYRCSTVLQLPECFSPHSAYVTFQNESYRVLGTKDLVCLILLPHLYVIAHILARLYEARAKAHLLTLQRLLSSVMTENPCRAMERTANVKVELNEEIGAAWTVCVAACCPWGGALSQTV